MNPFESFMKSPVNRMASTSQHTKGFEGYVFGGADQSQIAFWTASVDADTAVHIHTFDECSSSSRAHTSSSSTACVADGSRG